MTARLDKIFPLLQKLGCGIILLPEKRVVLT